MQQRYPSAMQILHDRFQFLLVIKSDLCISRNETALPRSQFLHYCICERIIYSQDRSAYLAAAKQDWKWKRGNRETEHYNSVLQIMRPPSFISGNTLIETRNLYWTLTGSLVTVYFTAKLQRQGETEKCFPSEGSQENDNIKTYRGKKIIINQI